ncbi:flagellin N-terminal helical domain-containing protein [Burkholderia sp. Ac-20379]|uniref:flagellin N-terminal helical domain-containing protein n=1 Tax=Burkholderia sp. Ac-20379 TaxID=2703900 RepID=UPI00197D33A1|nr:flagellar hook-associated protein 3 [Burkholderia sp. Ac-20379]MBN3727298.1 flagellar hook-associated protein 3 [Burkholderia sp. Ac-20379]
MRIASQSFGNSMVSTLRDSNAKIADLTARLGSGRRIHVSSDDPVGAVRLMRLERDSAMLGQYRRNIGTLRGQLEKNELHLGNMQSQLDAVRETMLRAMDGTNSAADLNAMAGSLRTLRDDLVATANASDSEGHYLFSGTLTGSETVRFDASAPAGARYAFGGNLEQRQVVVGNGMTQAANVGVDDLADTLNRLDLALERLEAADADASDPDTRAAMSTALDAAGASFDTAGNRIAGLGGAQNTLDRLDDSHEAMLVANGQAADLVGGLDYAEATDALNNYLVAVKGSYQIYARVRQLSLFDVL